MSSQHDHQERVFNQAVAQAHKGDGEEHVSGTQFAGAGFRDDQTASVRDAEGDSDDGDRGGFLADAD